MKRARVQETGAPADAANDAFNESAAVYRWLGPTYFGLLSEFGTNEIPLVLICEKFLGMSADVAKNEAARGTLPIPVYRLPGGQKRPWLCDAKALANYLDEAKTVATKKFLAS